MTPDRTSSARSVEWALLRDGSLQVIADLESGALVEQSLPRTPLPPVRGAAARARVQVRTVDDLPPPPTGPPAFDLEPVLGWPGTERARVTLAATGMVHATVDLCAGTAEILVARSDLDQDLLALAFHEAFTATSAFLMAAAGRPLLHGAAVVAPDGCAWLLVGPSWSGKTTTCINLVRSGLGYLSDDFVVISEGEEGLMVEGWPRRFNVDTGFESGRPSGVRRRTDPEAMLPGRWRWQAPLGGLLFPELAPGSPTTLREVSPAQALVWLIRQSSWLLAHRDIAAAAMKVLQCAARHPAHRLTLGSDVYTDVALLRERIVPAIPLPTPAV